MSVRVTRQKYWVTTYVDGVAEGEGEWMGAERVKGWLAASEFFDNLVDTPEVHEKLSGGVIKTTRVTPWGAVYVTVFTP